MMSADKSEEPVGDFDQTNGIVEGLDGDDGGAIENNGETENIVTQTVRKMSERLSGEDLDEGETPYSEEGRP